MSEAVDRELSVLRECISDVPDFPKQGILFRDVTPLLASRGLLSVASRRLVAPWAGRFDSLAGIESRGFVFASSAAVVAECGLHLIRKPGKLPPPVDRREYTLEYGSDALEVRRGIVRPGERVLLIDDVLATGGTAVAAVQLLKSVGANVVGAAFLIGLGAPGGAQALKAVGVVSTTVLEY